MSKFGTQILTYQITLIFFEESSVFYACVGACQNFHQNFISILTAEETTSQGSSPCLERKRPKTAKEAKQYFLIEVFELYQTLPAPWKIKSDECSNSDKKSRSIRGSTEEIWDVYFNHIRQSKKNVFPSMPRRFIVQSEHKCYSYCSVHVEVFDNAEFFMEKTLNRVWAIYVKILHIKILIQNFDDFFNVCEALSTLTDIKFEFGRNVNKG